MRVSSAEYLISNTFSGVGRADLRLEHLHTDTWLSFTISLDLELQINCYNVF